MARVVDAQHSTLIGTPEQLRNLLALLAGKGAAVVNLKFSNFVVLDKPLSQKQLEAALRITPKR
jgi:hypothetical protein